eukprot:3702906-Lingulodinium_polyedra.AAC.1
MPLKCQRTFGHAPRGRKPSQQRATPRTSRGTGVSRPAVELRRFGRAARRRRARWIGRKTCQ